MEIKNHVHFALEDLRRILEVYLKENFPHLFKKAVLSEIYTNSRNETIIVLTQETEDLGD